MYAHMTEIVGRQHGRFEAFAKKITYIGIIGLAGASELLLPGCSSASPNSTVAKPLASPSPNATATTQSNEIRITFSQRGGGSNVVEVFPSPTSAHYDGTYFAGQTAFALCQATGRLVVADTQVGETPGQSDQWDKLDVPGQPQFAPDLYVEAHPQLSRCSTSAAVDALNVAHVAGQQVDADNKSCLIGEA